MKSAIIFSLILFFARQNSGVKPIFHDKSYLDSLSNEISFDFGNVDSLIKNETDSNSKNVSFSHFVGIRDGKDFDSDSLHLEMPIAFATEGTDSIDLSSTYYFDSNRNLVLRLYEWNTRDSLKLNAFNIGRRKQSDFQRLTRNFNSKFLQIKKLVDSAFGNFRFQNMRHQKRNGSNMTRSNSIYWKRNGIKVHLYRFNEKSTWFNQIRLVVYRK